MLKHLYRYGRIGVVLTLVWVALNERADLTTIAVGLGVSILAVALTNRLVLLDSYRGRYGVRPLRAVWYVLRLLGAIYIAGFQAVRQMFTGRIHVGIVDIRTDLDKDLAIVLLANSITLTPGTVTLDRTGRTLRVIWLNCTTTDPAVAGPRIKGPFERLLRGTVR